MQKKFTKLQKGDVAVVKDITLENPYYRQKLLAMGILPGTEFKVLRSAPLGDPIEIGLSKGLVLSLGKRDCSLIEFVLKDNPNENI